LDKWFRVDNRPFKAALLNIVKKWSYMFKQYLMEEITSSLTELDEFVKQKDKELVKEVPEGNYERLTTMMDNLGAVRSKTEQFDGMFDPIKKKIELLKNYGQEVPDDVYTKLQQLPEKWTNTKKLAMQAKQAVSPLQTAEVANLRRKTASFDVEQYSFRENFRKNAPFTYASQDPYSKLDMVGRQFLTV
jgi:dynein heavy chain